MEDRYAITIAMGFFMAIITTAAILVRLKARQIRHLPLKGDDYTIIAAWIFTIGLCVCNLVGAFAGRMGTVTPVGPEGAIEPESNVVIRDKTIWILQWLAALAPGLTKISVLLFYRRIFVGTVFKITCLVLLGLSTVWTISFFFANFLDCLPLNGNWLVSNSKSYSKGDAGGITCVDIPNLFWAMTISDIILDALILMLPWYPVWKLQMPVRQKLSVCAIFLLGAFVVVAGGLRLWAIDQAVSPDPDHSYTRAPAFYWATIESGIGVVSACLPTMWPVLGKVGPESIIRSIRDKIKGSLSHSRLVGSDYTLKNMHSFEGQQSAHSAGESTQAYVYDGSRKVSTSLEIPGNAPPSQAVLHSENGDAV